MRIQAPIDNIDNLRLNNTLHGHSRYRKANVSGHNIFHNWDYGDAVDLFAPTGTHVYAPFDCSQIKHSGDATTKEVIHLSGRGYNAYAVMAHINAFTNDCPHRYAKGDKVGVLSGLLKDPHLHFELEIDGESICGSSSSIMRSKIVELIEKETKEPHVVINGREIMCKPRLIGDKLYARARAISDALDIVIYYDSFEKSLVVASRVDRKPGTFAVPAFIEEHQSVVPVREFLMSAGVNPSKIMWESGTLTVVDRGEFNASV